MAEWDVVLVATRTARVEAGDAEGARAVAMLLPVADPEWLTSKVEVKGEPIKVVGAIPVSLLQDHEMERDRDGDGYCSCGGWGWNSMGSYVDHLIAAARLLPEDGA